MKKTHLLEIVENLMVYMYEKHLVNLQGSKFNYFIIAYITSMQVGMTAEKSSGLWPSDQIKGGFTKLFGFLSPARNHRNL